MKFEHQKSLVAIPLIFVGIVVKAALIVKAWELLVSTTWNVPEINIKQAIAMLVIYTMLPKLTDKKDELDECKDIWCFIKTALMKILTTNAAFLAVIYVLYWLMV